VAGGCGLRQGQVFGLGVEDLDFDGGWLHVQRQIKVVRNRLVFGLPKNDRDRRIPLPASVAKSLTVHMETVVPLAVTLPWEEPAHRCCRPPRR
jgi:integrase